MEKSNGTIPAGGRPGDDIEIARMVPVVWAHRWWIAAGTLLATVLGCVYALMATPVYYSQATIALNESGKGGGGASGIFAQLGGVGGMVASQLGMMNTSLDKVEIILKGHELADSVIVKNGLMPLLYAGIWNAKDSAWTVKKPPTVRDGVDKLRKTLLKISTDPKKGVIHVGARASDSTLSKRLVDLYLAELNAKIRRDVMTAADTDRGYLEGQLARVTDPVLRDKILGLIAVQFEKSMLVSSRAFDVLEGAVVPKVRVSPKRTKIAVISLLTGLALSVCAVFAVRLLASLRGLVAAGDGGGR